MITSGLITKTAIFFFSASFLGANALNCYICAENGLDEFGECKTSFPFSCDGYAKRFAKDEKIFCRTTRHKTANGTFTVVKECIADSAHHVTFPRKPYQLAEECDVVDLNGVEVAYCLCGDQNLCNGEAIVGQFSAFEEKYPELFDSDPTTTTASDVLSLSQSSHQRSAEEKQRERSGEEAAESAEEPMESSTWHGQIVDGSVHFGTSGQFESAGWETATTEQNQNNNNNNNNPFVAPPTRNEDNNENEKEKSGELVTFPLPITTNDEAQMTASEEMQSSKAETAQRMTGFQCFQCKESNLQNGVDDCRTQTVANCADLSKTVPAIGRPLCLSRQIVDTKNGRFQVEKGCASERAILNELGAKAVPMLNALISGDISCDQQRKSGEEAEGGEEKWQNICICATAQCNGKSVGEQQMLLVNPQQMLRLPFSSPSSLIASSSSSSSSSFAFPTSSFDSTTKSVPNLSAEEHFLSTTSEPLNCAVCLDVELGNSVSDCRNAHSQNCGHKIRDEKAYCLTRQTQNGKDAFIVEKSCVTTRQFYQQFPEELEKHSADEVPIGCDATYDGFVNYCLCDGQMCNRNSLSEQAQRNGKSGKMRNITRTDKEEKHGKSSEEKKRPLFVPSAADLTPIISMRPIKPSAELVKQEETGGKSLGDDPSPPNWPPNWPSSDAPNWPTSAASPILVPATTPPSNLIEQNDRLKKWKQNSERAKRPFESDGGEESSDGKRTILSMGIGIVHAMLTLFASLFLML
ncbi:hypothetical protein niasHT_019537 [Heterodera trifolii]|uniref:Uncharacterized protein n=1 Tax=Heterodera trifolii TaxID=157864 RepID=A0ABD2KWA7_9BILA